MQKTISAYQCLNRMNVLRFFICIFLFHSKVLQGEFQNRKYIFSLSINAKIF